MNDYMTALHQRFYREPDFSELGRRKSSRLIRRYGIAWIRCSG